MNQADGLMTWYINSPLYPKEAEVEAQDQRSYRIFKNPLT